MRLTQPAALKGIRVLDVTGTLGAYVGRLFAQLGADVILVEPPGGSSGRRRAPFIGERRDPEASLSFAYLNAGKRSLILDLDTDQGQETFRCLVATSNLVIEAEAPGTMAARGLGYADLRELCPSLVMVSITPFGQDGPYAHWLGEDIVGLAMGGMLSLAGYPGGPPMAACGEQAFAAAGLFGAVGAMLGVLDAERSGEGSHVDVSVQQCVVLGLENALQFYELEGTVRQRNAGGQRQAGTGVFACADGHVYLMAGGIASNRFWGQTVDWLVEVGAPGAEALRDPRWLDRVFLDTEAAKAQFLSVFGPYAAAHTKVQLRAAGQAHRVPIAPVATPADILNDEQLLSRGYLVSEDLVADGRAVGPGAPYRLSATPWHSAGRAPRLDEHRAEILNELHAARPAAISGRVA